MVVVMRLSASVAEAVKKAGVKVYYANRVVTKIWNANRMDGEPVQFGGWYWWQETKGTVVATDDDGPFRCESAAVRDAFKKLQLRAAYRA